MVTWTPHCLCKMRNLQCGNKQKPAVWLAESQRALLRIHSVIYHYHFIVCFTNCWMLQIKWKCYSTHVQKDNLWGNQTIENGRTMGSHLVTVKVRTPIKATKARYKDHPLFPSRRKIAANWPWACQASFILLLVFAPSLSLMDSSFFLSLVNDIWVLISPPSTSPCFPPWEQILSWLPQFWSPFPFASYILLWFSFKNMYVRFLTVHTTWGHSLC